MSHKCLQISENHRKCKQQMSHKYLEQTCPKSLDRNVKLRKMEMSKCSTNPVNPKTYKLEMSYKCCHKSPTHTPHMYPTYVPHITHICTTQPHTEPALISTVIPLNSKRILLLSVGPCVLNRC